LLLECAITTMRRKARRLEEQRQLQAERDSAARNRYKEQELFNLLDEAVAESKGNHFGTLLQILHCAASGSRSVQATSKSLPSHRFATLQKNVNRRGSRWSSGIGMSQQSMPRFVDAESMSVVVAQLSREK
jgi:hypothetical protein